MLFFVFSTKIFVIACSDETARGSEERLLGLLRQQRRRGESPQRQPRSGVAGAAAEVSHEVLQEGPEGSPAQPSRAVLSQEEEHLGRRRDGDPDPVQEEQERHGDTAADRPDSLRRQDAHDHSESRPEPADQHRQEGGKGARGVFLRQRVPRHAPPQPKLQGKKLVLILALNSITLAFTQLCKYYIYPTNTLGDRFFFKYLHFFVYYFFILFSGLEGHQNQPRPSSP